MMTDFEKGYRKAQENIIAGMYDMEGDFLFNKIDRLEKIVGLPAAEISDILNRHLAKRHRKEFEQIAAECNSKEEIVRRLLLVGFVREFIKKNLHVSDEFINHCLYDQNEQYEEISAKMYHDLTSKKNKSAGESEFCDRYGEELQLQKKCKLEMISRLYTNGSSRDKIYKICDALDITRAEADHAMQNSNPDTVDTQETC